MSKSTRYVQKTRTSIILSSLIQEPFASLYVLLPFILIKNFKAAAIQIVLLTMLKPIAALFSFYWSEKLSQRKHTLKMNLLGAGLMARLPFVFALFFDNVWLLIGASTLYMLFLRASIPAWMEILKLNLPARVRERYFAIGSALGYAEGVLIAIGVGSLLDTHIDLWRFLFLGSLLLGIIGVIIQVMLPIRETVPPPKSEKMTFRDSFTRPWLDCFKLMKTRSDFRRFQWAFMIGGLGLMIIQPVIPIFFAETLKLSFRDLMIAYSICKGFGFVLTSPLWSRYMSILSVGRFTSIVLAGFALFSLLLTLGIYSSLWVYLAYFVYGIAQAGSHLIWHLSGPVFANDEDSSRYSGVNIVMVGARGMIGPPLGGLLAVLFGPIFVLYLSVIFCLSGVSSMLIRAPKRLTQPA